MQQCKSDFFLTIKQIYRFEPIPEKTSLLTHANTPWTQPGLGRTRMNQLPREEDFLNAVEKGLLEKVGLVPFAFFSSLFFTPL